MSKLQETCDGIVERFKAMGLEAYTEVCPAYCVSVHFDYEGDRYCLWWGVANQNWGSNLSRTKHGGTELCVDEDLPDYIELPVPSTTEDPDIIFNSMKTAMEVRGYLFTCSMCEEIFAITPQRITNRDTNGDVWLCDTCFENATKEGWHTKDSDCTVVDGVCIQCHVSHEFPCPECGGKGYHKENCIEMGAIDSL